MVDPNELVIAQAIRALRRRVAPPGSYRERLARALYAPLVRKFLYPGRKEPHFLRPGEARNAEFTPQATELSGRAAQLPALPDRPRVLVLKLDHIGDFVVGLPAMAHLRASFPNGVMSLICAPWNQPWAERSGLFDRVIPFDFFTQIPAEWRGPTSEHWERFEQLDLEQQDLAIDLRHDPDTRPLLTRVPAEIRAGFCAPPDQGGNSLDIALPDVEHISREQGSGRALHAELRLMLLAQTVTTALLPKPHPAKRLLTGKNPLHGLSYAVLAPGAGSPIRIWPASRLIEVGCALTARYGLDIAVTGSQAEVEIAAGIIDALPAGHGHNLAGLPLSDLPDVLHQARIFIGHDTGTTHLAAALGVPTVSLLSGVPNHEVWHTSGEHVVILRGEIACSPCHLVRPTQCPRGVACLEVISVDRVLEACDRLLSTDRDIGQTSETSAGVRWTASP